MNVNWVKIEAELLRCPAVRDATVIRAPHSKRGKVGVTLAEEGSLELARIVAECVSHSAHGLVTARLISLSACKTR